MAVDPTKRSPLVMDAFLTLPSVESGRTGDLSRIVTIPNALSLLRIALVGCYLALLFDENARVVATIVLAVAGFTDFLDGYLARRLDQVTTLGKILDPTADRILLGAAISSMVVYGAVPLWLAALVLSREGLVAGAVLVLAARGAPRMDVSQMGKSATFGLMVCFPLLLLAHGSGEWAHGVRLAAWILLVPSLLLSLLAAIRYIPVARRGLEEQRNASTRRATETADARQDR